MNKGRGTLLIVLGLILIAAAVLLVLYNVNEDNHASESARDALAQLQAIIPTKSDAPAKTDKENGSPDDKTPPEAATPAPGEIPDYQLNPQMDMPEKEVDGHRYIGIIEIPSLGISLPVISQWSYEALSVAPCRYSGSVYTNDLVIAGHNYRSHFGKLSRIKPDDTAYFTDIDGNVFEYRAIVVETLHSSAVEEMKSGEWDLSLFTCTLGGGSRTTVRLNRTDN